MKKILILGGAGFIGSNIANKLAMYSEKYQIIIFDAQEPNFNINNTISYIKGDFNNIEHINKVLSTTNYDIVIHLISTTIPANSNKQIIQDINQNLIPSVNLLESLVKYNVRKIIFFSSGGSVYGDSEQETISEKHPTYPISSHGTIKLAIEKYIHLFHKLYGLDFLILRPSNPYGRFQNTNQQGVINVFIRKMLENNSLVIRGDGNTIRDYIYIDDVSEILEKLISLDIGNEILNIGSGSGTSVNEILQLLKDRITFNNDITNIERLDSDIYRNVLNIDKLKGLIDFEPTKITDGIDKLLNIVTEFKCSQRFL